ncbi:MAG: ABC transporter substrate-binding protein [Gammaproteobacteria bacterium]|nr:ABC transporter substrate-binding protein [Gammaproteobacteria bacterium]
MEKPRPDFGDQRSRKLRFRISGAALLVFLLAAVAAWWFLPPSLPHVVRLGTGPVGGHYARFAEALRAEVREQGIELELVTTVGSAENIRLLLEGEIDVGLVQSGNITAAEAARLVSIAAVFYEPVLIVERADWESGHIQGGRIAIGLPGSGSNLLARKLLEDQGVRDGIPPGTRFVEIENEQALEALWDGRVDSGIFTTSLDLPWVESQFTDTDLRVTNFSLAEAFSRHYRFLQRIRIPAGLINLKDEIPPNEMDVIATTASLVTRPDVHSALIPLLIASLREQLYQGGLLAEPERFPSAHGVEAPLADGALDYFERGPSFFYRWLPYRYAHAATRLSIFLLPFLTLLYPLLRSLGPTYRWVNQRRVYRWYSVLERVEKEMDESADAINLDRIYRKLDKVEEEIRDTHVPSRFGGELFALRAHLRLLFERSEKLRNKRSAS